MNGSEKQAQEIRDKVRCGYLHLSYGIFMGARRSGRDKVALAGITGLMVECYNLRCGPKFVCNVLEGGTCKYRSEKVKLRHLFEPDRI